MPRVTELCTFLADRFHFEESKVLGYARILREAGLLTSGARGVNAPDATTLDAARLLIAMMLRAKKDDAATAVQLFGSFEGKAIGEGPVPQGTQRLVGAACEQALAQIIAAAAQATPEQIENGQFTFSIVRDLAYVSIIVSSWPGDDDPRHELENFSGWDEFEFRFFHPEFAARDPEQGPTDALVAAWNQYRSGFYEVPILHSQDLVAIGQFIEGRSE